MIRIVHLAGIALGIAFGIAFGIALMLSLLVYRPIVNYPEPEGPLFSGDYAGSSYVDTRPQPSGEIKVITWNIKFSEKIDTAIAELDQVAELQHADIILLQEMDETGVDRIARALRLNYVYFPASVHNYHAKNFGNAILSPWPLSDPLKVQLPHANPKNGQTRIVTRAVVTIGHIAVPVYSVHTETMWLSESKRLAQFDTLATEIGEASPRVIMGGDFNTLTGASIKSVTKRFSQANLTYTSSGAKPSFSVRGLDFSADHIFSRGMTVLKNGVWPKTQASDHFPVWVTLTVEN